MSPLCHVNTLLKVPNNNKTGHTLFYYNFPVISGEVKYSSWQTHFGTMESAAAAGVWTHLGGQGAESRPSCHHICCTHWSREARTHRPAPTLERWSAPPCSRQTVASPLHEVSQAVTGERSVCRWSVWSLETRCRKWGETARVWQGGIILRKRPKHGENSFQLLKMELELPQLSRWWHSDPVASTQQQMKQGPFSLLSCRNMHLSIQQLDVNNNNWLLGWSAWLQRSANESLLRETYAYKHISPAAVQMGQATWGAKRQLARQPHEGTFSFTENSPLLNTIWIKWNKVVFTATEEQHIHVSHDQNVDCSSELSGEVKG